MIRQHNFSKWNCFHHHPDMRNPNTAHADLRRGSVDRRLNLPSERSFCALATWVFGSRKTYDIECGCPVRTPTAKSRPARSSEIPCAAHGAPLNRRTARARVIA